MSGDGIGDLSVWNAADARRLLVGARGGGAPAVEGVWHAAGVLADGLLARQTAATLARVYGPKAHAAWSVQRGCAALPLRACALFSSVAALLGGAAQANYAAANGCLDALAAARRAAGEAGVAVQWGPWAEVGMAAGGGVNARLQASGWGLIGLAEGLAALGLAVGAGAPPVVAMMPISWGRMLGGGAVPPFLSAFAPVRAAPGVATAAAAAAGAAARRSRRSSSSRSGQQGRQTGGPRKRRMGTGDADSRMSWESVVEHLRYW